MLAFSHIIAILFGTPTLLFRHERCPRIAGKDERCNESDYCAIHGAMLGATALAPVLTACGGG
jgi:hypothetical protein